MRRFLVLACFAFSLGCSPGRPAEGYRVTGYDSESGQWTIIRNGTWDGEHRVKRLTIVCEFYQSAGHEPVAGKDACSLQVGRLIMNTWLSGGRGSGWVMVDDDSSDWIAIVEGEGAGRVSQHFRILKQELVVPALEKTPSK